MPTSSPVQFEPEELRQSIARLLAREPEAMYLTHYGRVEEPTRLAGLLLEQLDGMVALAEGLRQAPARHQALVDGMVALYRAQLQRHGVTDIDACLKGLALDIELNAQGLAVWLDRDAR